MKIVLTGPKCSGKSRLGRVLGDSLSLPFYETDTLIEELFKAKNKSNLSCRAICAQYGEDFFRKIEQEVVANASTLDNCVISTGGSTMLNRDSRQLLRRGSILVLVTASIESLLKRLSEKEIPSFLNNKMSQDLFALRAGLVNEVIKPYADIVIDSSSLSFEETLTSLVKTISSFLISTSSKVEEEVIFLGIDQERAFVFGISCGVKEKLDPSYAQSVLRDHFGLCVTVRIEHPFIITVRLLNELSNLYGGVPPAVLIKSVLSKILSGKRISSVPSSTAHKTQFDLLNLLINI